MQNIKLTSIDFEQAKVKLDFLADEEPLSNDCLQTNQQIVFTITNFAMELEFENYIEGASTEVEEFSGIGKFIIKNATLVVHFKPYLSAERIRFTILDVDFRFQEHKTLLRGSDTIQISETFESFGGVISENLKKHLEHELSAKLALKLQQALHFFMFNFYKQTKVKDGHMHINKNIIDFCVTKDNILLFIRGNFQKHADSVSQLDVN